jgi:hypothetical protein
MTRANRAVAACDDLSGVQVECAPCGVPMTMHMGNGQRVRYFQCPSCRRWLSSTYADVLRADAKFQTRSLDEVEPGAPSFDAVKDRLERWLATIEEQDPCRVLGVSPQDPTDWIRSRYRELALESHPDRGGSEERMREINLAYERLAEHRKRHKAESAPAAPSPALPTSSK